MTRKVIVLNLLLLALLVWVGIRWRQSWLESKAREQAALTRQAKPATAVPPPAVPPVGAISPAEYLSVAQQNMFSKDRNPNVIVEPPPPTPPPPPPPPEPPVPPLPKYYGQMAFGQPVIVLSTDKATQKGYHVGDKVGEFTIAEFDSESVTLGWNGKSLKRAVKDLAPKEEERRAAAPPVAARTATNVAARPNVSKMGEGPSAAAPAERVEPEVGKPNGAYRDCVAGDNSPAGTVKSGYKKVMTIGLMGNECHWESTR
ncbi:MAG: hypothetical protein ABI995_05265 [Acidobacteriota bacterium]